MEAVKPARPLGMRLIIGYKLVKAVLVLAAAIYLTASTAMAYREARYLISQLIEHGGFWHRLALWLDVHVTLSAIVTIRVLAWLDGATTVVEAALLWSGKTWGEWMVIAGLAALLPFEAHSLWLHRRIGHAVVLLANTAIVVYLARRRYLASAQHQKLVR